MKLTERIMAERITALDQLSATERTQVRADRALQGLIEENRALATLAPQAEPPIRQKMLEQTFRSAADTEESSMSLLSRVFKGRKWYVQAALAAALLVAIVAVSQLLPQNGRLSPAQAWAKTDGFMLVYDLGMISEEECAGLAEHPVLAQVETTVREWAQERRESQPDGDEARIAISVNADQGQLTLTLAVLGDDEQMFDELQAVLAEVAGLPEPTLQPATWFLDDLDKFDPHGGLTLGILDHHFSFPPGASEEEIEATINAWVSENHPDTPVEVDVTIDDRGEEKRLEVRVMLKEEDAE